MTATMAPELLAALDAEHKLDVEAQLQKLVTSTDSLAELAGLIIIEAALLPQNAGDKSVILQRISELIQTNKIDVTTSYLIGLLLSTDRKVNKNHRDEIISALWAVFKLGNILGSLYSGDYVRKIVMYKPRITNTEEDDRE